MMEIKQTTRLRNIFLITVFGLTLGIVLGLSYTSVTYSYSAGNPGFVLDSALQTPNLSYITVDYYANDDGGYGYSTCFYDGEFYGYSMHQRVFEF